MSILDSVFPERRREPRQILAKELARQTNGLMRKLVQMRIRNKLSQEAVADRMGISRSAVAQMERYDANPTMASIRRYALAVDALVTIEVDDGIKWAKDASRRADLSRGRSLNRDLALGADTMEYMMRAAIKKVAQ